MAGGMTVNRIASWDGSTWQPLGSGITEPDDPRVHALAVYHGNLVVGGQFAAAGETSANNLARWNGTTWQPLGVGMDDAVSDLIVYNGQLIAGGSFLTAGGDLSAYWAQWGPTTSPGDFDGDALVDLSDFSYVPDCLTGPTGPFDPAAASRGCLCSFNADGDGDVDLLDFSLLQKSFTP